MKSQTLQSLTEINLLNILDVALTKIKLKYSTYKLTQTSVLESTQEKIHNLLSAVIDLRLELRTIEKVQKNTMKAVNQSKSFILVIHLAFYLVINSVKP